MGVGSSSNHKYCYCRCHFMGKMRNLGQESPFVSGGSSSIYTITGVVSICSFLTNILNWWWAPTGEQNGHMTSSVVGISKVPSCSIIL